MCSTMLCESPSSLEKCANRMSLPSITESVTCEGSEVPANNVAGTAIIVTILAMMNKPQPAILITCILLNHHLAARRQMALRKHGPRHGSLEIVGKGKLH